ncbi:MAG: phosphoribosyltransferase [Proteobacteria bacterium]|nr:phosphoribosyltransferase [Pseudomonadota bacterium]
MAGVIGTMVGSLFLKYLGPVIGPIFGRWSLTIFGRHRRLSHKDILKATDELCEAISNGGFIPHYILGIDGAGLYIASLIGNGFKAPVIEFAADRRDPAHPRFPKDKEFFEKLKTIIKDKRILLVDDLSYTGQTLRNAKETLQGIVEEVKIAVISIPHKSLLREKGMYPAIYNYSAKGFEHKGRESIKFPWPV